jgi:hypothetical protein
MKVTINNVIFSLFLNLKQQKYTFLKYESKLKEIVINFLAIGRVVLVANKESAIVINVR